MARRGRSVESRWIARGLHAPAPEEVMALGLGVGEKVARLERVRSSDGVPLAIERASLSQAILPDPEGVTDSLYAVLQ
ncbi:UTRA domain-containing protein, partial [Escherichia coli]